MKQSVLRRFQGMRFDLKNCAVGIGVSKRAPASSLTENILE